MKNPYGRYDSDTLKSIIQFTLDGIGLYSLAAQNLLILTAIAESNHGEYLSQMNDGPAKGIFQMESATLIDHYKNYLKFNKPLWEKIFFYTGVDGPEPEMLVKNIHYAVAMARVHYLRDPYPLPRATDIKGLALYWKAVYNTYRGKGDPYKVIEKYMAMIKEDSSLNFL